MESINDGDKTVYSVLLYFKTKKDGIIRSYKKISNKSIKMICNLT